MTNVNRTIDPATADAIRLKMWAARASIFVALTLIVTKIWAVSASGSQAMLGSLMDSGLDLLASIINIVAVYHAARPADDDHRFGHEKAEALAGIAQTFIILGSAIFLMKSSVDAILSPRDLLAPELGIGVSLLAMFLTTLLVSFQAWVISRTQSVTIKADHLHYKGDLLLNAAVVVVFMAGFVIDAPWLDGAVGCAIAAYIAWNAVPILIQSTDILMDKELPDDQRSKIEQHIKGFPGVLGHHELRTRTSGNVTFIQVHIDLPGTQTLTEAHDTAEALEESLEKLFHPCEAIIHLDPV